MKNVKLVYAAVVLFLLLLNLLLRLVLGNSKSFFLIASIEASIFFSIFITIILKLTYGVKSTSSVIKLIILTIALSVFIVAIAVISCIRFGYSTTFYIIGGVDILLLLVLCSCLCCRRDRRRGRYVQSLSSSSVTQREEVPLEYSHLRYVAGLPKNFRYDELAAATNNFQNRIGRGGSGSVFKGVLSDGSVLAVKRIEGEVRGEREFWNELVTIASVQHFNLVRLLGCCLVPGNHLRFLVYEFIENGSLDSWVFKKNNGGEEQEEEACLTWPLRYQVAVDIAKALAYLHHDCRLKILHLDVKPENILLDADFRGHLSDFGISRLMKRDETSVLTTVRGTRGYLAPEWFFGDGISEKSDVYSFGMVLLELVGGQRNMRVFQEGDNVNHSTTMKCYCFPRIASEKLREGKVMEVVDERLLKMRSIGVEEEKEVKALVCIALWCIQEKPEMRPSMELVVDMLERHVDVSMPPVTRMFMGGFLLPLVADNSIREEEEELTVDSSMQESSIDLH